MLAGNQGVVTGTMPLFKISGAGAARKLAPRAASAERDVQRLFEENLEALLGVTFLAHEYSTTWGGRIDTLGIDRNGSPVIIEYKKGQNDSVINQGLSYLRWHLDHRDAFEKLCRERKTTPAVIDWRSPRVICVAESYNRFDIDTAELLPIRVELLRYQLYEGDVLLVEAESFRREVPGPFPKPRTGPDARPAARPAAAAVLPDPNPPLPAETSFDLEHHLASASAAVRDLFQRLRERIVSLDDAIVEAPKQLYVAYKTERNFADVVVQRNGLKVYLNLRSGELSDPQGIARDLTKPRPVGHWGNGDYEVKLSDPEDLEKVFSLVRQSYERGR
jgi:predicted transport protein